MRGKEKNERKKRKEKGRLAMAWVFLAKALLVFGNAWVKAAMVARSNGICNWGISFSEFSDVMSLRFSGSGKVVVSLT
ncbi:hypothetical protein C1646_761817 [Rhizophagus diaphanus]|nr:hypothetical protein C1646_761817 [Rhizophagus diaphanus] [Rhizophagus sp. MUCL 43196]